MERPELLKDKNSVLNDLLKVLCAERGEKLDESLSYEERRQLLHALFNVRPPEPVTDEFLEIQDALLWSETVEKGIVEIENLDYKNNITLWQGDITRLNADAIVNACNSALLGCFQPLHKCIDNAIHTAAGVQVSRDCQSIMNGQHEPNGQVQVTGAYNLPSKYIFHTVGPIVSGRSPSTENKHDLTSSYRSCLNKADELNLSSIAFCCLSTGVFGYPNKDACKLAVRTVLEWQQETKSSLQIIFNVFLDKDRELYENELS